MSKQKQAVSEAKRMIQQELSTHSRKLELIQLFDDAFIECYAAGVEDGVHAGRASVASLSFKPDWANYAQGVKDGKAEVLLGCNEIDDKGVKP